MRLARIRITPGPPCSRWPVYFWPIERVGVEELEIPVPGYASFMAWHRLLASWPRHWGA